MLYKQALEPLKENYIQSKAENLGNQLYDELKSSFLSVKNTTNRERKFINLANSALKIKVELLLSNKNYEIKYFDQDDLHDEDVMQIGKDYF